MAHQMPSASPALLPSATGIITPPLLPSAYTAADVPLSIKIKPKWANSRGPTIRRDCLGALRLFPKTGLVPPLYDYQSAVQGECALAIYVTNPAPEPPTYVEETWERVFQMLWPAIHFLIGSLAAGWRLDLQSGVQLLFFEYAVVPGRGNRISNTGVSMEESLDWLAPPRPTNLPTATWMDIPPTPTAPTFMSEPAFTIFPTSISSNGSLVLKTITSEMPFQTGIPAQPPYMVPYTMRDWTAWPPMPLTDCKNAMKSLFLYSWFFEQTGGTFERPYGNTFGRCTVGIYMTSTAHLGLRIRSRGLNIYHELWQLAVATIYRQGAGGFMNLPNGVQVVIYERPIVDPRNVCAFMNKIPLRTCLDNRAQARLNAEQQTAAKADRLASMLAAVIPKILGEPSPSTASATSTSTVVLEGPSQKKDRKGKGKKKPYR